MAQYTSEELNGVGVLYELPLNAGETATFNFNFAGSNAVESLSGSAYFTMERKTTINNEYAANVQPLTGKFENVSAFTMEDLGFVENTYRWSIVVGNTLNSPRITWVPDFDVTDFPVMIRATGGINVDITVSP
tara:strand:- start:235 stop:633 length:399 start_codon:yes stop_codon:yes gene_type:complete